MCSGLRLTESELDKLKADAQFAVCAWIDGWILLPLPGLVRIRTWVGLI